MIRAEGDDVRLPRRTSAPSSASAGWEDRLSTGPILWALIGLTKAMKNILDAGRLRHSGTAIGTHATRQVNALLPQLFAQSVLNMGLIWAPTLGCLNSRLLGGKPHDRLEG